MVEGRPPTTQDEFRGADSAFTGLTMTIRMKEEFLSGPKQDGLSG